MEMLTPFIPLFKVIHIVGFTAWFAGMFYLVRIFVYHEEAFDKAEPERIRKRGKGDDFHSVPTL